MEREATDPLAAGLLHEIVSDLESQLNDLAEVEAQLILIRDYALEPGRIEFHERSVSCLVRSLSEHGAAIDVISPRGIPDHFTLVLPLEGASHRCRLVWRRDMEIGVTFQQN
ncbi:PilZ domain-containing protein [Bradyrhizobium sp. STM 3562]|uniref:PilZ domain-containing protein n=1 Tax=Bradyrhizobium sp. STM 3562 TaxID=578924 RepID=UPI00389053F4